jgi:hypothetical protein
VPGGGVIKNLTTALYGKITGSAFSTSIGGRLYKNRAPQNPTWPYAMYFVITDVPQDLFVERIEEVLVQFSIFSQASGTTEIEDAMTNLKALYDNCTLTITGNTFISMRRVGGGSLTDIPGDTTTGTGQYYQYDVDYEVLMKRN